MNPPQPAADNKISFDPKQSAQINLGGGGDATPAKPAGLGATPSSGFSFGAASTPAASSFNFPQTTAPNQGLTFSTPVTTNQQPATTATSGFSFAKPAATVPATSSQPSSTVPASSDGKTAAPASSGPTQLNFGTSTTPSSQASANMMNFCQMEELINKWTLELEEQEKIFTNQATQVNVWDKVLLSNSDKIINLSEAVEKVKNEQQTLEQKLEYIAAQHTELDECITPLQKELTKIPHVDVDKAQTYLLAESLDTQLKQMSEDLKEVIEHLNETNKIQDSTDPIVQIGKILNAHMSSLQWIETNTSYISGKLQDITEMHNSLQKDNERSLRLAYHD